MGTSLGFEHLGEFFHCDATVIRSNEVISAAD